MSKTGVRCQDKFRYFAADNELRFVEPAIKGMLLDKKTVVWSTFRRKVCLDELRDIFPYYNWRSGRLDIGQIHIRNDPNVQFYRSRFSGCPCYFLLHCGTEYIFLPVEAIIHLRILTTNI